MVRSGGVRELHVSVLFFLLLVCLIRLTSLRVHVEFPLRREFLTYVVCRRRDFDRPGRPEGDDHGFLAFPNGRWPGDAPSIERFVEGLGGQTHVLIQHTAECTWLFCDSTRLKVLVGFVVISPSLRRLEDGFPAVLAKHRESS